MWLLWLLASALTFVSIVGMPFSRACYNLSELAGSPFGKEAINRRELTQKKDIGTSAFGVIGNVVWFLLIGFWLAVAHVAFGIASCITLVGIPFGLQHFKMAGLAVMPIGKAVVSTELAQKAREENARSDLEKVRAGMPLIEINQYDD